MATQKNTLELRIELAAKEARESVVSLNVETVRLAAAMKDMNLGSKASQDAMSRLEKYTRQASQQMSIFGATSNDLKKQQTALQSTVKSLLNDGLEPESDAVKKLAEEYKKLGSQSGNIDKLNSENIDSFGKLKNAIGQSAAAIALVKVAEKIKDIGAFALESANTFQKARNEFGTLLGDMNAGAGLFEKIKAFNDVTPFDLETTKQGVNVLLSAQVPLSNLTEKLTMFGDLSQGNSQKFTTFINAFSKGAAKGSVDMEVLNMYLDQGVPILQTLADGFGKTKAQVVDMASSGKLSFEDFSAGLERLTSEGGRYYGGMALGSKDLSAMQEGLKESVTGLAASYGQILFPTMKTVLALFTGIVNAINDSPFLKGLLAAAIAAVSAALIIATVRTAAHAVASWAEYAGIQAVNLARAAGNPLIIAGIIATAAATVAVVAYAAAQQKAASATSNASLAELEHKQTINASTEALNAYLVTLDKMTDADLRSQLARAQSSYTSSMSNYGESTGKHDSVTASFWKATADVAKAEMDRISTLLQTRKLDWIDALYGDTQIAKVKNLQDQLQKAKGYLGDPNTTQIEKDKISAIIAKLQKEIEDANKKTTLTIGTDWQDKNLSGIDAINREQQKSLEQLQNKATSVYGANFQTQKGYTEELDALNTYYDTKRTEALKKSYGDISQTWRDKMLSDGERLSAQLGDELKKLDDQYNKSGQTDSDYSAYKAERLALIQWESDERTKLERTQIMNAHNDRLSAIKQEWEYQRELARQKIESGNGTAQDYVKYAQNDVMAKTAETDVGKIASGSDPVTMFISALVDAALKLENVNKLLNFIGTFVDAIFSIIGPLIDGVAGEFVDNIIELGTIAGQIIAPLLLLLVIPLKILAAVTRILLIPLKMLGDAFEWLYNNILVPFGNAVIDMINGVIDALNHIPFVDIDKLDKLSLIGDASEELAAGIQKATDALNATYDAKIQAVQDLLDSQIGSIKKQYELGLINRSDYQSKAEKYNLAAGDTKIKLDEERNKLLAAINENTAANLTDAQKESIDAILRRPGPVVVDTAASLTDEQKGASDKSIDAILRRGGPVTVDTSAGDDHSDLTNGAVSVISDMRTAIANFPHFDVGTSNVPTEMPAIVHPGEIIVPRTFSDGIRSGDLALVGPSGATGSAGNVYYFSINVEGSVTTEKGLVSAIHTGICKGIASGELDALPA